MKNSIFCCFTLVDENEKSSRMTIELFGNDWKCSSLIQNSLFKKVSSKWLFVDNCWKSSWSLVWIKTGISENNNLYCYLLIKRII